MAKSSQLANPIYKYNRSFSGTDTVAFIMLPGCSPVTIGSLTTISYSIFRNKKPVINIGRTNINGLTRGSRIFAGTMVFTLINQHWVKELVEQQQIDKKLKDYATKDKLKKWLGKVENLQTDELPIFDIMIVSANEYGAWCSMYIWGIDVTDEAQTISVQDLFTENVFQFVARDVSTFEAGSINPQIVKKESTYAEPSVSGSRMYILSTSAATDEDVSKYEYEYNMIKREEEEFIKDRINKTLGRTLYETGFEYLRGADVAEVQGLINASRRLSYDIEVNGVFDSKTSKAVMGWQSSAGIEPDGIVTDRLYQYMIYDVEYNGYNKLTWDQFNHVYNLDKIKYPDSVDANGEYVFDANDMGSYFRGYVINKFGAFIYKEPSIAADIVGTIAYQETVRLYETYVDPHNTTSRFYRVKEGYVSVVDVIGPDQLSSIVELPRLEYGQTGAFVRMVEQALAIIFPLESITHDGTFGITEVELIKRLQETNGLTPTGIVDMDTWRILQMLAGSVSPLGDDSFTITFTREPGAYNVSSDESPVDILDSLRLQINNDSDITIKVTATAKYVNGGNAVYKTFSESNIYTDGSTVMFNGFIDAFMHHPEISSTAEQIEIVVYPYNKKPYKWVFNYGG